MRLWDEDGTSRRPSASPKRWFVEKVVPIEAGLSNLVCVNTVNTDFEKKAGLDKLVGTTGGLCTILLVEKLVA